MQWQNNGVIYNMPELWSEQEVSKSFLEKLEDFIVKVCQSLLIAFVYAYLGSLSIGLFYLVYLASRLWLR